MADPNFRLQKGLFIGSQTGFVDAFNYMYENINGLEGGQGIELDKTIDGAWQINADQSTDGGNGGGGDYGKVVEDVTEDTQGDKDGLKIWYTDGNDSFIPFPSLSGGGGNVDDVSIIPHSGTQINDKLKVEYADGTDKEENIPFDPAVAQISRQWVDSQYFHDREVLSCVMNRGGGSFQVPFDIRLSGPDGSYNDASRWLLSSMPDTNLSVQFAQAGDDGVAIKLGVYYI